MSNLSAERVDYQMSALPGELIQGTVRLYDIAHARFGDKGASAVGGVIAYELEHYDWIAQHITADKVAEFFADRISGSVFRYELPHLGVVCFVLEGALDGGVSRSLLLDGHGKAFGSLILEMALPWPPDTTERVVQEKEDA